MVLKTLWGLKIRGKKNLPRNGSVIVACNHIAFLDPPVLGISLFREAHYAAKRELFQIPILRKVIAYLNAFPVNRKGFDNQAIKHSLEVLRNGGVLIMFPEGTRSRIGKMLPFKRGVGYLVAKTGATVLPARISGTNYVKKRLFKPGGITVRLGLPLAGLAEKFPGEEGFQKIAKEIQDAVLKLNDDQ
jgi:1-acyl-sn-glycerol-3-phosphate acyltransferase